MSQHSPTLHLLAPMREMKARNKCSTSSHPISWSSQIICLPSSLFTPKCWPAMNPGVPVRPISFLFRSLHANMLTRNPPSTPATKVTGVHPCNRPFLTYALIFQHAPPQDCVVEACNHMRPCLVRPSDSECVLLIPVHRASPHPSPPFLCTFHVFDWW